MLDHRHARRQRGFTLAEVMVATAIFAVIVIAALMIYDRSNRVFKESVEAAAMQQETRVAFDKLVRDVRMAGFDFDRDGVPMISTPTVWQRTTTYAQNRVVVPTTHNGFVYIAVNGGQSGAAEPAWQTTIGEITNDGTIRWRAVRAVYQQPDEQIEYAGLSAVTIRGNLDYTTDATNEHGRENRTDTAVPTYNYEPSGGQFPIVTTGNDEIVTYALKSDRAGAPNDDEIRFFADVSRPRTAYPGSGGAAEREVVISGVDLCDDVRNGRPQCIHPPYTLYRFTIDPDGRPDAGTPVASNIRSLKFWYYTSPLGGVTDANADGIHEEQLTAVDGTVITQGAIGGLGQYDPNNVGGTANFGDRGQRELIQSIRVQLIGMNSVKDTRYTNPAETGNAEALNYRTYQLESLIVPRNAGLRGMQEPVSTVPTLPTIRTICHGYCYATRVTWDPPSSGGVTSYEIRYGETWSTSNRVLPNLARMPDRTSPARFPGDQLVGYIYLPPHPSGQQWYVNVRALNEHGIADSGNALRSAPSINRTRPQAVTELTAANDSTNDQEPNQIALRWPRVVRNSTADSTHYTLSCTSAPGATPDTNGTNIPSQETIRYRIWRSTNPNFDPTRGEGVLVLDQDSANNPTVTGGTTTVTWTDDRNSRFGAPPANCTRYYYRIQAYDECRLATENDPANARHGESEIFPALDQQGIMGYAGYRSGSPTVPATPTGFRIDADNSRCRVGPNSCSISLVWNRVTTDTVTPTPNVISVDKYYIERQRKLGASGAWQSAGSAVLADPEYENNSLSNTPTITFVDNTAEHHDPTTRERYYYQYRVRAMNCAAVSGWTPFEDYPDVCPSGSSVTVTGTQDPTDGAWMMNAGDYVAVTPASGVTLTRVDFQLIEVGTDNTVATTSSTAPPYIFAWQDGQDEDAIFRLVMTIVQNTGCTEEQSVLLKENPSACPTVTRTVTGSAGGLGVAPSPYILNGSDTIELRGPADPAAGVLESVSFQLFAADGTTAIGSPVIDLSSPFVYTWSDRTDGTLYRLRPTVVFSSPSACTETLEDLYIRDEVCSGATTTATGAVSGDGTSTTTPWVMAAGATIRVNPPSGTTPQRVQFAVQAETPAGPAEPVVTVGTAPYTLTWADRTDETIYRVTITVIYSNGCQETLTRYVKDDPAACKLALDDPDGTILRITNTTDPTAQLIVRNNGTSDFILQNIDITWNRWDGGITWDNVTFPSADVYTINSNSSSTQSVDLSPLPTGFTAAEVTIAPGSSMTLTLNFTESGNRDDIEATDIQKVCVTYTRADTGTRQYACRILNVAGPDASPNNPTRCE